MGIPLILVRKQGKLPGEIYERRFDLEYGEDVIQIHKSDITEGDNILIIDDLIATGGTVKAAAELFTEAKAGWRRYSASSVFPFFPIRKS